MRGALPPAGTPNYFVSSDLNNFALDVFKFHVDFTTPLSSTFGISPTHAPNTQVAIASFSEPSVVPELAGNNLDSLGSRLMVQNQYRKIGGVESLWLAHTVDNAPSGVRWYQLNVSGGTVASTPVQQSTYKPDSSFRWVPSLAVDKFGNMLVGYSVSNSLIHPAIRYAGRLITDTLNSLSAEATLIAGRREPDLQLRRQRLHTLGRLFGHDRRSGGRLHVLVHHRVLRHQRRQLANPHWLHSLPGLRRDERAHTFCTCRW